MVGRKDKTDRTYLGDGAYARYTKDGVWLAVNDDRNEVVFLDWPAFDLLNLFVKAQKKRKE